MRTKFAVIVLTIFSIGSSYGQLPIEECYAKARANYPAIKQFELIEKSAQYNIANANSGYLPQISLSAKASYQSQVTELPIAMPGIGTLSRDQYGATIDVNQSIWDGGVVKARKEGIKTMSEVDKNRLDVELYALNERINQIYFSILLFDAQIEQNNLYMAELQRNYDQIAASIDGGVASKVDLDAVKVEQLKAIQNHSRLTHSKTAYVAMLSALVGEKLEPQITLARPPDNTPIDTTNNRPELGLYAARIKNFEAQNSAITSEMTPKLGLYISGGYGRPGLNMLSNSFTPYYIAGAKLSWNIGSFYNTRNSRRIVGNSIEAVAVEQKTFLFNSGIDITVKMSEIAKYRDQLQYDDNIVDLRTAVKNASESKVINGTMSTTDYMRDVTAQEMAKQDKIYHQIELLQAIYNLKYATNNF